MLTVLAKPVPSEPRNGSRTEGGKDEGVGSLPARLASIPKIDLHGQFLQESLEVILRQAVFKATHRESKVRFLFYYVKISLHDVFEPKPDSGFYLSAMSSLSSSSSLRVVFIDLGIGTSVLTFIPVSPLLDHK